jgi:hypothetical protein
MSTAKRGTPGAVRLAARSNAMSPPCRGRGPPKPSYGSGPREPLHQGELQRVEPQVRCQQRELLLAEPDGHGAKARLPSVLRIELGQRRLRQVARQRTHAEREGGGPGRERVGQHEPEVLEPSATARPSAVMP